MYYKVKEVTPLPDFFLDVIFINGHHKIYDVKPLFDRWVIFHQLEDIKGLFDQVVVDAGGYGICWSDDIDLECNELWYSGEEV